MAPSNRSSLNQPFMESSDASARSTRAFQVVSVTTLAAAAFMMGVGCTLVLDASWGSQEGKAAAAMQRGAPAQLLAASAKEVTEAELDVIEFDYVIVGAGSAGSVLAERLSKLNATVAVIEQGGGAVPSGMTDRMPGVRQILHAACDPFNDCGIGDGPGQGFLDGGMFTHPGAAFQERFAMGGTSSISVGAHFRGGDAYWGGIAKDFGQHWALSEDQIVDLERETGVSHKPVGDQTVISVLNGIASRAAGSAPDVFMIPQYNGGSDGLYENSYTAFLEKAESRKNLHVVSNMYVNRVKIQDGRAMGVIAQRSFANGKRGPEYLVGARREVLLAAGAVGSAALLRRSSPSLSELVRPLRDQPLITLAWHCGACNVTQEVLQAIKALPAHGDKHLMEQLLSRDVMYGHGLEMNLAGQKVLVMGRFVKCWACGPGVLGDQLEMDIVLVQPQCFEFEVSAHGHTSDVDRLTHEGDIRAGLEAVRLVKAAVQSMPGYEQLRLTPVGMFHEDPETDLTAGGGIYSFFAATATCRLGDVVDGELKVKGVQGLRAADASVLPEPPAGRPYFSIIKVAHVAAQLVMRDAMSK
ncbi:unnamed protein product [Polarella glacialis]|uniref:Glucose-methanol-choline oxidoreductase N-terminal domain-containing protein n=1 Tax=Polarella glacialis TaxID=89957 RepID=A0A813LCJ9_POLGL|nr:unnamed protein product [Polarella glacialis]CAE8724159.1 unnamed protein product [Polarella glacialis]